MASGIWLRIMKSIVKTESLNKITKEISKNKNVEAIFLFGSYARGKSHRFSDIDLCVILNDDNWLGVRYSADDDFDVSFFHLLPLAVQFRVFREGRALFIRNKKYIERLMRRTIREYLDFRDSLHRICLERLKCLT
jgi:predicted nucleotidyltransferase